MKHEVQNPWRNSGCGGLTYFKSSRSMRDPLLRNKVDSAWEMTPEMTFDLHMLIGAGMYTYI